MASLSRHSSASRSSNLAGLFKATGSGPCRPSLLPLPAHRRGAVTVRAERQQQPQQDSRSPAGVMAAVRDGTQKFLERYDPVATGTGSLLVAGYCIVCHGQSVGEALNIAACATVLGMVMQELLFNSSHGSHGSSDPNDPSNHQD